VEARKAESWQTADCLEGWLTSERMSASWVDYTQKGLDYFHVCWAAFSAFNRYEPIWRWFKV